MSGMIHIYCGDGKGKTTAAIGLAVRAAGAGKRVLLAQFLKKGSSSEITALRHFESITIRHCDTVRGWVRSMSGEERDRAGQDYRCFLETLIAAAGEYDLLILDEAVGACAWGLLDEARLREFLRNKPENTEVVLTGRNPSEELTALADYVTEMKKIRHPFDRGIRAREGVEY